MSAQEATAEEVVQLRTDLAATRKELGEVKALLRQMLERRRPRRPEPTGRRVSPEVRDKVRTKMADRD